jgi:hypothetical protein
LANRASASDGGVSQSLNRYQRPFPPLAPHELPTPPNFARAGHPRVATSCYEIFDLLSGSIAVEDLRKYKDEIGEVALNHLYDLDDPTSIDREISKDEEYYALLLRDFSEITDSFDILKDIPPYIRSFPYRNKRIEKPLYRENFHTTYFQNKYS